ncbi:glycerate kinase [uncultured Maribacter sp.]|uniref:glycerate kinase n=1 Tax=uncultured Maribacter sp. TaxID=431308 RepID=UPI0026055788|nr:glycerate kinase [uncultured Maribacter sp.]
MMNYLLIPDKFKGSLTATEVIDAISKGIKKADVTSTIFNIIASDGGDGFLDAISNSIPTNEVEIATIDPMDRPLKATYLLNATNDTAYIELAKASGLELLKEEERNVMQMSTYGTGLQIKDAVSRGVKTIYLGLGGSATNDAGIGIASALGYIFKDKNGEEVKPIGANLATVFKIEKSETLKKYEDVKFYAVNDVDNPLFGINGAAHVYGEQKGASKEEIAFLDKGLVHINKVIKEKLKKDFALVPGAGAAGGTAYGLKTFFDATYVSGVDFLLELAEVPKIIENQKINYIVTGEGKIDSQTIHGKLVNGVVKMARKYKIPVVAICGKLDTDANELKKLGVQKVMQTYSPSKGVKYSMENASQLIEELIEDYFLKTLI